MIERKIVEDRMKELQIEEFITSNLKNSGHSHTRIQKTPLGEKIIIYASRPGLVVGRKGENIKRLTAELKEGFKLENPQIEISEVDNINLDAQIVAERIAASLERYGPQRFKGVAHRAMTDATSAGALGIEIVISGKVPSTRAKSWRFYQGYLKKCGDLAISGVNRALATSRLKSGVIGIKVSIMPPTTKLPDDMKLKELVTEEGVADAEEKKEKKREDKRGREESKEEGKDTEKEDEAKENKAKETKKPEEEEDVSKKDKGAEEPERE